MQHHTCLATPCRSAHPGVAKVAFTGSVATGRRVYAAAAGNLRPATMELGGKSGEAAGLMWEWEAQWGVALALPLALRAGTLPPCARAAGTALWQRRVADTSHRPVPSPAQR